MVKNPSPKAGRHNRWGVRFLGWEYPLEEGNAGDLGSTLDWEDPLEKGMATYSSILA